MSQWELKVKTSKLSEARENADDQVAISFSFGSDWLKKLGEFPRTITSRNRAKPKQLWIIFEIQLKIAKIIN